MPRGDGTGPLGQGPRTGRAAGYCAGYTVPGYRSAPGRGFWRGRGRGYWWRTGYPAAPQPVYGPAPYRMNPEDETKYLEGVAETMKKELEAIEKRIKELSSE